MAKSNIGMSELEELIISKSSVKQDVYTVTKEVFVDLKEVLAGIASELEAFTARSDQRISIQLNAPSDFECQMTLAGDTTIFQMHTNVFMFPPSHMIHRSPYVMKEPKNGYCGVINVFNFLTDSFRYQRMDDSGYLIARIFINRERHFFVEGQQQLGYLFNDFNKAELTKKELKKVLELALKYILNFELYTPPFSAFKEVKLSDIEDLTQSLKLQTSKRLGFRFQADEENEVDF
ncbi:hypothetical protein N9P66_02510 [Salibacteraceae bacterium]|nr:hypothetical protein [Salibacteraceae bacterium]